MGKITCVCFYVLYDAKWCFGLGEGATSFHVFLLGGFGINDAQFEVNAGTIHLW